MATLAPKLNSQTAELVWPTAANFAANNGLATAVSLMLAQKKCTILCLGTSLGTANGSGSTLNPYPAIIQQMFGYSQATVVNNCKNSDPGWRLSSLNSNLATLVDPYIQSATGLPCLIHLDTGGADILDGDSAATIWARYVTFLAHAAATTPPTPVTVCTVPANQVFSGAQNTVRLALNVLIKANTASFSKLHPLDDLLPLIAGTYFVSPSNSHPSQDGHLLIAQTFLIAISGGYQNATPGSTAFGPLNVTPLAADRLNGGLSMAGVDGLAPARFGQNGSNVLELTLPASTSGWNIYKGDRSTLLYTFGNTGKFTVPGILLGDIAGAFAGTNGLRTTSGGAWGELAGALFMLLPSGGLFFYNNGPTQIAALDTSGNFSNLGQITAGTVFSGPTLGVSTNSSASAGRVGEIISAIVAPASAVSLTTNTGANVTSISLTAGDWDVEGIVSFGAGAATVTSESAAITSTSATIPVDGSEGYSGVIGTLITFTDSITLTRKRFSLSGTTTVYLAAKAIFAAGTIGVSGNITARRVR